MSRSRMLNTGHEYEKITVVAKNPEPGKYNPIIPGQFAHRRDNGGPQITLSKYHNFTAIMQLKLDKSRPGPGAHVPEH